MGDGGRRVGVEEGGGGETILNAYTVTSRTSLGLR